MIEIRTADYEKLENILEISEEYGITAGIGSESCTYKLPHLTQVRYAIDRLGELTLVTPITPQRHYRWMLEYIQNLPSGVRLVLNDAGMLYSLYSARALDRFHGIIAGRGIVHTSEACPWIDHLIRDEPERIRDAILQTNLNYSRTRNFFTDLGISGIETDLQSRTVRAAIRTGLPVSAHIEFIAVSYARSCHTSRFYNEVPPDCVSRCNTLLELELVDMFDLSAVPPGFAQPSPEMKKIFPVLYLRGNTIFMRSDCTDIEGLDKVIVLADMYDHEGLGKKIEVLKSLC